MLGKRFLMVSVAIIGVLAFGLEHDDLSAGKSSKHELSNDWITDAGSDAERFERIQKYLRGFDQPMWEVGERYENIHQALTRGNHDLALYHWRKIRVTIANGVMKRPGRKSSADDMFLDAVWSDVRDAFESGDESRAWEGFRVARDACMACHEAEDVGYMNDQPLFNNLKAP